MTAQQEKHSRRGAGSGAATGPRATRRPAFVLDRASVRRVDREAVEQYAMPSIILMENAARALAVEAIDMLEKVGDDGAIVLIICGSGNNGGDGWALARHLHNAGYEPVVAPIKDPNPNGDAGINCAICRSMGIREIDIGSVDRYRDVDLIVDAIFGTGLDRMVEGRPAEIIEWINGTGRPVLAVDIPSGLDGDTGKPLGVCVRADRTVSFVGWKPGFLEPSARGWTGKIIVGDIGAPRALTERYGRPLPEDP
jgi:hydroxyethylthiazole kinase-like uncharacterized protein yjeF